MSKKRPRTVRRESAIPPGPAERIPDGYIDFECSETGNKERMPYWLPALGHAEAMAAR